MNMKRRAREREAVIAVVDAMSVAALHDKSTANGAQQTLQRHLGMLAVALGEACEKYGLDEAGAQRVYDAIPAEVARRA